MPTLCFIYDKVSLYTLILCSQSPTFGVTARVRFLDGSRGQLDGNTELQNFILSDHIRLRMLDYFTGNTTIQHRYYSISEITIAARYEIKWKLVFCLSSASSFIDVLVMVMLLVALMILLLYVIVYIIHKEIE